MSDLHTFVVCAFGKAEHLEDCILSLLAQTVKSSIVIAASAPDGELMRISEKYGLPLRTNGGRSDMAADLTFAILQATASPYVTLADASCVYEPTYTEAVLARAKRAKEPLLIFTDCYELKDGQRSKGSQLQRNDRFIRRGFRLFPHSKLARSFFLSMGCSICPPTVTYSTAARYRFRFNGDYTINCDWDAFERIGRRKGSFIYIKKPLVGLQTDKGENDPEYGNDIKSSEDYYMFRRFWPKAIANIIHKNYSKLSEKE